MKKFLFVFIILNAFVLQADILFYYMAGVLPAAVKSNRPVATIDSSENIVNQQIYAGQTPYATAGARDNDGIVYCRWTNPDGSTLIENIISPPMKDMDEYTCPFEASAIMEDGNFIYTLIVKDTSGKEDSNELNVTVLPNNAPTADIGSNREIVVGNTLNITAVANDADGDKMTYQWMYGLKGGSSMHGAGTSLDLSQLFDTVGLYVVKFEVRDSHGVSALEEIDVNVVSNPNSPENFNFTDEVGVNINQWFSSSITVRGLASDVEVDISSSGYPREDYTYFLVNGQSDILKVKNADVVKVAHLSSNQDATTLDTIITIGGISDTFSTTTKASDNTKIPLIVGAPNMGGNIHELYSYTPQLSTDYNNFAPATKPFTIENKPSWASFDSEFGELSGTPTLPALHRDVKISAYGDNGMDSIVFDITITEDQPPYINGYGHTLETPNLDFTFNDNANWRSKITEIWMSICYGSAAVLLNPNDYTFAEGNLTLHSSTSSNVMLRIPTWGGGELTIKATDYVDSFAPINFIDDGQYAIRASLSIDNNIKLNEGNLNGAVLDINLSNYLEFIDNTLDSSNFVFAWNIPSSISIDSVNYINATSAQLHIAYDGTDFDNNVTLYIDIAQNELNICQGASTNSIDIEAVVEVPKYIYPDDPTKDALFGFDIDTDNEKVATLARNGIYIHEKDINGEYQQVQKIVPSEENNISADDASISIDGEYLIYGDGIFWAGEDGNGLEGKVYIYKMDVHGLYQLEQEIVASGLSSSAHFGASVDLSDDLLIVGAYNDDDHKGAAYLYQLNVDSGDFEQKERLTRPDGKEMDWFGYDVAIDGDYFVVGSMSFPIVGDDKEELGAGFAYYYNYLSDSLEFMAELKASDLSSLSDHFGISVDISSDHIIVGTYHKGAYLFKREFDTASENGKLAPTEDEDFGHQVSILYSDLIKYIALGESGSWNMLSTKGFAFVQGSSTNQKNIIETNAEDGLSKSVSVDENFAYFSMPYNEDKKVYHHGAVMVAEHGQSYNLDVEDTIAYINGTRDLIDVELDVTVVFDAEISQINSEVNITIVAGEYSMDGGSTWTSSYTTIYTTQSIKIRHTSSVDYSTSVFTTLNVGTQSAVFTSTTLAEVVEAEGTVTVGDLMWEDTAHVRGGENNVTWNQADTYCKGLELASYYNWRLPHHNYEEEINELGTIMTDSNDTATGEDRVINEPFVLITANDDIWSWTDEGLGEEDTQHIMGIFSGGPYNFDGMGNEYNLSVRCVRDVEL